MKHPGTFNANPLSAAAGVAALKRGRHRRAVPAGERDRAGCCASKLNDLFAERGVDWVAYGDFSGFKLLPDYHGPRPTGDDFIPYGGDLDKLDGPKNAKLVHAFRRACC